MTQDNWTTYIKKDGKVLLSILADRKSSRFEAIVAGTTVTGETVDEFCDKIKAALPREDMTSLEKNTVREKVNFLSEEYGGMSPGEYIDRKREGML